MPEGRDDARPRRADDLPVLLGDYAQVAVPGAKILYIDENLRVVDNISPRSLDTFGNKKAEGNGKMKELLGGKGANLAEMNLVGIPVPPGFTITTEVCAEYYEKGREGVVEMIRPEVEKAIRDIEEQTGMKFGEFARQRKADAKPPGVDIFYW